MQCQLDTTGVHYRLFELQFPATHHFRGEGTASKTPPQTIPSSRRPKTLDQLRPWLAREVQAATSEADAEGQSHDLVFDVVCALLREYNVDGQEGFCKVKEQVRATDAAQVAFSARCHSSQADVGKDGGND